MKKRAAVVGCFVVILLSFSGKAFAAAASASASVDQVLAALAQVVQERGKRVAAAAIASDTENKLCSGKLDLVDPKDPGTVVLPLRLGGSKDCRDKRACNADDIFVKSCRLLGTHDVDLTDPYFLKSLSRETVSFGMRVSAFRLKKEQYEDAGLAHFADFVHDVLEEVGSSESVNSEILIEPTLRLAEKLSPDVAEKFLAKAATWEETATLLREIETRISAACQTSKGYACERYQQAPNAWIDLETTSDDAKTRADACSKWLNTSARERDGAFKTLFTTDTAARIATATAEGTAFDKIVWPGEFLDAEGKSCDKARPVVQIALAKKKGEPAFGKAPMPEAKVEECHQAELIVRLAPAVQKVLCAEQSPDPRRDFRNLAYIWQEREIYRAALTKSGHSAATLDAWYRNFQSGNLSLMPREELSNALRILAYGIQARRDAPAETEEWLRQFKTAIQSAVGSGDLNVLDESPPLSWQNAPNIPAAVRPLRSSVVDLLALPRMAFLAEAQKNQDNRALFAASEAILDLFKEMASEPRRPRTPEATLDLLARLITTMRLVIEKVDPTSQGGVLETLEFLSTSIALAADEDWVGLAIEVSEEIQQHGTGPSFEKVARPLSFVRVLMSMYQAESVDDAKALFEAVLEDEASREERFSRSMWDINALLAVRGGYQWTTLTSVDDSVSPALRSVTRDEGELVGIYAPIGVQGGFGHFGFTVYPIDLGTFIVSTRADSDEDDVTSPQWPAAVRLGAAAYYRFSPRIPVVLGGGADYRPRFDGREEIRVFGTLALELPLFVLD